MTEQYTVSSDRELPPVCRSEANFWKAEYFKAMKELTKANKGIRRLHQKVRLLKTVISELKRLP